MERDTSTQKMIEELLQVCEVFSDYLTPERKLEHLIVACASQTWSWASKLVELMLESDSRLHGSIDLDAGSILIEQGKRLAMLMERGTIDEAAVDYAFEHKHLFHSLNHLSWFVDMLEAATARPSFPPGRDSGAASSDVVADQRTPERSCLCPELTT